MLSEGIQNQPTLSDYINLSALSHTVHLDASGLLWQPCVFHGSLITANTKFCL